MPPLNSKPDIIRDDTLYNLSISLKAAAYNNYSVAVSNDALLKTSVSNLLKPCLLIAIILPLFVIISANN